MFIIYPLFNIHASIHSSVIWGFLAINLSSSCCHLSISLPSIKLFLNHFYVDNKHPSISSVHFFCYPSVLLFIGHPFPHQSVDPSIQPSVIRQFLVFEGFAQNEVKTFKFEKLCSFNTGFEQISINPGCCDQ